MKIKRCSDLPSKEGYYLIATHYSGPQVWKFENGKWDDSTEYEIENAVYVEVILSDNKLP